MLNSKINWKQTYLNNEASRTNKTLLVGLVTAGNTGKVNTKKNHLPIFQGKSNCSRQTKLNFLLKAKDTRNITQNKTIRRT